MTILSSTLIKEFLSMDYTKISTLTSQLLSPMQIFLSAMSSHQDLQPFQVQQLMLVCAVESAVLQFSRSIPISNCSRWTDRGNRFHKQFHLIDSGGLFNRVSGLLGRTSMLIQWCNNASLNDPFDTVRQPLATALGKRCRQCLCLCSRSASWFLL
jgi:hypothetical protein